MEKNREGENIRDGERGVKDMKINKKKRRKNGGREEDNVKGRRREDRKEEERKRGRVEGMEVRRKWRRK